jgi:hypothetical protein
MWILVAYCTVICLFGFPKTAHAYLDPGTGSALLQGVAAVFLLAGMYMRRMRTFVSKHLFGRLNKDK